MSYLSNKFSTQKFQEKMEKKCREFRPVHQQFKKKLPGESLKAFREFQGIKDSLDDVKQVENGGVKFQTVADAKYNLYTTSTVSELKKILRKECGIPEDCKILLVYSNMILYDNYRTLKFYGIENNAFMMVFISERKDGKEEEDEEDSSSPVIVPSPEPEPITNLNPLEAFIRRHVQSVSQGRQPGVQVAENGKTKAALNAEKLKKEAERKEKQGDLLLSSELEKFKLKLVRDLDLFSYDYEDNCVEMPCGHGMMPDTLTHFCKSEMKEKKLFFKCPHLVEKKSDEEEENTDTKKEVKCSEKWKYPIIRRVLMMNAELDENGSVVWV